MKQLVEELAALNETESEVQETAKKSKKAPRPVILIYRNIDSYTIITPKSMALLSDGQREPSDRTLAGYTWVISADCSEVLFQIGNHKISYNLPKDITNDATEGLTEGNDTNGANSSTDATEGLTDSSTDATEGLTDSSTDATEGLTDSSTDATEGLTDSSTEGIEVTESLVYSESLVCSEG